MKRKDLTKSKDVSKLVKIITISKYDVSKPFWHYLLSKFRLRKSTTYIMIKSTDRILYSIDDSVTRTDKHIK